MQVSTEVIIHINSMQTRMHARTTKVMIRMTVECTHSCTHALAHACTEDTRNNTRTKEASTDFPHMHSCAYAHAHTYTNSDENRAPMSMNRSFGEFLHKRVHMQVFVSASECEKEVYLSWCVVRPSPYKDRCVQALRHRSQCSRVRYVSCSQTPQAHTYAGQLLHAKREPCIPKRHASLRFFEPQGGYFRNMSCTRTSQSFVMH